MRIRRIGKRAYKKFADRELKAFFKEFYGKRESKFHISVHSAKEKMYRFAAMEGDRTVGALSLQVFPGIAKIGAFSVVKSSRDLGIGSKLLEKCESVARKMGCRKIWLFAFPNWPAYGFYKKHGYRKEALLRRHWGGKSDLAIMSKFL